ncbi:alpha/beta-hydrolase [Neolentinus lepideus HHB14362 ss-1]|uniref:Carboxypeptidase n=1 Tax=Neolentinus lepideus HHB14362 ss-1 TaxID=1314782 RepID=A0A165RWI4_9AGAM|nr:alpha/beta-hydrolase [Neolentinus lepideus HHB14362 ss-1]
MRSFVLLTAVLGLLCASTVAIHRQNPFTLGRERLDLGHRIKTLNSNDRFDPDSFKPLGQLSALSNEFTTLGHPAFPKYSVRVKKSDFCDGTVAAYTGYIDVEARHLFFYFFESRNDPAKDDVIFWTNGGPGGSSTIGLFMELGPCRVVNSTATKFHPESWNSNANVFFIDQPVGVGYSYAEYGETVRTTEEAAVDIAAFVAIFFEHFSEFKNRGFHMAGESYAGRYLPLFASAVYDQNAKLVEASMTPVNLSSIMIGSGYTDQYKLILSYYDMQCTPASVPPILDISTCVRMRQVVPRCQKLMQASCIDVFDSIGCSEAMSICRAELEDPFRASGVNPYDLSRQCEGGGLCYPIINTIDEYLAQPSLRKALGVDRAVTGNHTTVSQLVGEMFRAAGDSLRTSYDHVAALLERDVRVLIFVGTYDWICNWVGNERWLMALEWSGKAELAEAELRGWNVDGKEVGKTRTARTLTWATIYGAGHMAPYDKPKESLELVNRWLAGEEL